MRSITSMSASFTCFIDDPSRRGKFNQICLVTSFFISTRGILRKKKNLVSTELKQYADGSSKPKPLFSSYLASIPF